MLTILGVIGFLIFLTSDLGKLTAIGLLGFIGHGLIWVLLLLAVFGVFK